MGFLRGILKTVKNIALVPVDVMRDVVDERPRSQRRTEKRLDKIDGNVDEIFDGDLL